MRNLTKCFSTEIKKSLWKNNLFESTKNESEPNNFLLSEPQHFEIQL